MKMIEQSHEILDMSTDVLQTMERIGRTCYKSEDKITPDSAPDFVSRLISRGHHAMIEFGDITVRFITNRGVTHELVRHRLCSFAQESTRYVRYSGDMEFITPVWFDKVGGTSKDIWHDSMVRAEQDYQVLLDLGWSPQQSREVLPNSLKTEIVMKGNLREWRHILTLRCAKTAHPQMFSLMRPLLAELQERIPVVFDDINF
jgi:thymidylate synthase (FAD)